MPVKVNENEPSAKKVKQQKHRPMSDCCHCVFRILYFFVFCISGFFHYSFSVVCTSIVDVFVMKFIFCSLLKWANILYYVLLIVESFICETWIKLDFMFKICCVLCFSLWDSSFLMILNCNCVIIIDDQVCTIFPMKQNIYFWFGFLSKPNATTTENWRNSLKSFSKTKYMQFIVCNFFLLIKWSWFPVDPRCNQYITFVSFRWWLTYYRPQ